MLITVILQFVIAFKEVDPFALSLNAGFELMDPPLVLFQARHRFAIVLFLAEKIIVVISDIVDALDQGFVHSLYGVLVYYFFVVLVHYRNVGLEVFHYVIQVKLAGLPDLFYAMPFIIISIYNN